MPADGCAEGFTHDDWGGCEAILPASCPKGQMAIPGEAECRAVFQCPQGRWGTIPVDARTQFVDAAFQGTSDGSSAAPWTKIGDAVLHAPGSGTIAIAAGRYAETLDIVQPVRIFGTCPGDVEVAAYLQSGLAAFDVRSDGVEIHDLSITGSSSGIVASAAMRTVVDRVWMHDLYGFGVTASNGYGPAQITLTRSLLETMPAGAVAYGAELDVAETVIRDMKSLDVDAARGIAAQENAKKGARLTVQRSVIERTRRIGMAIQGTTATIEGVVIRDTFERGVNIQPGETKRSSVVIHGSVVERAHDLGVGVFGSDIEIERSVVRGTAPRTDNGESGDAFWIQFDTVRGLKAKGAVRSSLLDDSYETGVAAYGADLELTSVLVRDVKAQSSDGQYGDGVMTSEYKVAATATIAGLRIESSARAGLSNFGASVALSTTALECNAIDMDGEETNGPFTFDDQGNNSCACEGKTRACRVLSSSLSAPKPMK